MSKTMKNLSKRIVCILCVMVLALTMLPRGTALPENVQASTASTNRKAVAAYKKMLAKSTLKWSGYSGENRTKYMKFICQDLNKDGIKELVIYNPYACYASGMTKIYAYQNGKAKCIYTTSDTLTFYPGKSMIYEEGAHTGGYWDTYYKMEKNGKLTVKASKEGVDMKVLIPAGSKAQYTTKKYGLKVYYYEFKADGKDVSYKTYKSKVSSLKKNAKKSTAALRENTAANRAKYIK